MPRTSWYGQYMTVSINVPWIKVWKYSCFRTGVVTVVFLDISCINIIISWESVSSTAGAFGQSGWEHANLHLWSIHNNYCSSYKWACCFCLITCIYKYQRNSTSLKISDMNGLIEREVIATKTSLAQDPMAWQLVTLCLCPKRYAFLVRNRQVRQVIQKIKFIKKSPEPIPPFHCLHTIPELNRR